jgi:hypothetical protein
MIARSVGSAPHGRGPRRSTSRVVFRRGGAPNRKRSPCSVRRQRPCGGGSPKRHGEEADDGGAGSDADTTPRRGPRGAPIPGRNGPRRSPDWVPGRAMRGTSPRSRSQARCSAEKYALSARSLTGRRRRGPRRERTAGIARTSGLRARLSCVLAPDTATASGMPWAVTKMCSLQPCWPRSTGFGPVSDPPFGPRRRGVHDRRGPVEPAPGAEFVQDRQVQPAPQAGPGPGREPAVRRRGRDPERLRQMPPGTSAGQHEHHRREDRPFIQRGGPTPLRSRVERRQQWLDQLPQPVRNQPPRQIGTHKRHHAAAHTIAT